MVLGGFCIDLPCEAEECGERVGRDAPGVVPPYLSLPLKGISNSNGLKQRRRENAVNSSHNKNEIQQIIAGCKGRVKRIKRI